MQIAKIQMIGSAESTEQNPLSTGGPEGLGHSLWQFDGMQWQLKKDCSIDGARLTQPTLDGTFKGQLRSTASIAV